MILGPGDRVVRTGAMLAVGLVAAAAGAALAGPPTNDPPAVKTRRALDHLGDVAVDWQNSFDCNGCHKQPMPIVAYAAARRNGWEAARPGVIDALIDGMLTLSGSQDAEGCFSLSGASKIQATTFNGRGLEAWDRMFDTTRRQNLLDAADCLLARQAADGSLPNDHTELPVAQGSFATTAHGLFTWKRAGEATGAAAYSQAAAGAETWLRGEIGSIEATPSAFKTQDKAMLLAGIAQAGAGPSDPDVVRMYDVLAAEQQTDGSWKLSDAAGGGNGHATGQVVFALRKAGFDRTDPPTDDGTQWLLDNQQSDGSWRPDHWEGGARSDIGPSMWGALALASYPSPLNGVRVSGTSPATISWTAVEGATGYDAIRGDVAALAGVAGDVTLGAVSCRAADTPSTSFTDAALPATGKAFFYVMRIRSVEGPDIYGRSSGGLDRVASSGDCPP